jgi:hypothetical protein
METSKLQLFTTFLSTLTRKSSAVFGLLIIVSGATLFFSPQTALASTYVNADCTVQTDGHVGSCNGVPNSGDFYGFAFGTGHDTGSVTATWFRNSSNTIGGIVNATGYYSGFNFYGTAEGGYLNGTFTTNDGDYWIEFTKTGSAYSGDWSGTIYYQNLTRSGGVWSGGAPPPPPDPLAGTTHIASTTPADLQNTATSTSYFLGVEGEITPDDWDDTAWVEMAYYNDTLAQAVVSPSVVTDTKKWDLTTSGTFAFSTTTNFSNKPIGRYWMMTSIKKDRFSLFGFSFWSQTITSSRTSFYVSTSTAHISSTGWDRVADTNNPDNITAIQAGITTCDFSWADFASTTKISGFLVCLIKPDSNSLSTTFKAFQNDVLTLAPWGYVTRTVVIMASTTPVMPPALTYTFGSSSPAELQGKTYSMQIFDHFDIIPLIKADDGSNKGVWDIIDPFVTFLVTIGVFLVILSDLMGFEMPQGQSENERMAKIDYSKMSDKEFQKRVKIEYLTEEEQRMQRRNRL